MRIEEGKKENKRKGKNEMERKKELRIEEGKKKNKRKPKNGMENKYR